nr:hypothetical protein BaRGS_024912 [Batillaria attramentaria]
MSAETGQLRLTVAALSAKLGGPREQPATVKTSKQPKAGARCYWCDQTGHFERACPAKESYRRRKRPRRRGRKSKGQHKPDPPSTPAQQTAHPHQRKENPADPVGSRQASGG